MKKKSILVIAAVILINFFNFSYSQDTAKIMSYNLLNYNINDSRNLYFKKTFAYSNPDILAVCEILSASAMNQMAANVLNANTPSLYTAGTFIDGPDTDNAIFYKTSKFTFVNNTPVHTNYRDINIFTLIHNISNDTLKIIMCHLKASTGFSNEAERLEEVNLVRSVTNTFPANSEFLILGDFNIYSANESAYSRLLQVEQGNDGHFLDPYTLPGTWNQSSYAQYHSQSTRLRSFGGGATGGMDDRFDFILNSRSLTQEGRIKFIPNSLKPFGNDGNHYNDSINQRPNTAVPDSIADALAYGSDHLPVYGLYKFDPNPNSLIKINLATIFEGLYSPVNNYLARKDTIKVFLRDVTFPYSIRDSASGVIDSISFSNIFTFTNAPTGTYYIVIKHLNSIETWSKTGGEYLNNNGVIYNYDYSSSGSQAFGNNLVLKGSKYCLYSGDVNQDGNIDLLDVVTINNDAANFTSGYRLITDLNGDLFVDLADVTICYNNSVNFISKITP